MGLGILLALLLAVLLIDYLRRPARLDDPVIVENGAAITLPRRVDPNTATAAELTELAGGGAFLLFTSHRALEHAARDVRDAEGVVLEGVGFCDGGSART